MEWNQEINDIWNLIQKTTLNVADLYPVILFIRFRRNIFDILSMSILLKWCIF